MHANIINSLILLTIILALIGLYCSVYSRGVADGTDSGYKGGYSAGKSSGAAQYATIIRTTRADAEQLRHLREIERREYRTALEAIMLDCDQRICIFARRANPFTTDDQVVLLAITNKLQLAASTFDGLHSPDHARLARTLQQHALNMAERLRTALNAATQSELPTSNRSVLVYGPMACGKTRNAQAIADALGLTDIRDEWYPGIPLPHRNALALTNSPAPFDLPATMRLMSFEEAMDLVEGKHLEAVA